MWCWWRWCPRALRAVAFHQMAPAIRQTYAAQCAFCRVHYFSTEGDALGAWDREALHLNPNDKGEGAQCVFLS